MKRIMFVCHGNICRSPMAEFIFKDMVKRDRQEDEFVIQSAATSNEEIWNGVGNPVYPPAREELLKHGLSCEGKRAVQLKKTDYNKFDLFLCMDGNNERNAIRIFGGDPDAKVKKLMSYAGLNDDVADPWYTGNFKTAYKDIVKGCNALLEKLNEDGV